jgi:hypothetical protein
MNTLQRATIAVLSLGVFACSPAPTPSDAAADTVTPPADTVTPPADVVTPPADVVTPPADVVTPPADVVTPPADVVTPPADVVTPPADGGGPASACTRYCTAVTSACSGANAQYDDMADCLAFCGRSNIPVGREGDMAGNTLECRIYHAGVAVMAPAVHCPHAGPSGGDVCGTVNFNLTPAAMFTRVDRMGMPAVSTALVGAARKNPFNDGDPAGDMSFAGDFITSLTGLHAALDDDLARANLTACSMTTMVGGLPECLGQTFAPGRTVASLVVPNDVLRLDLGASAGFPNGRRLQDPVIDVTLSVLLLRINSAAPGTCGMAPCSPTTLAGLPLNPPRNDVAMGTFPDTFPYLHPPHTP